MGEYNPLLDDEDGDEAGAYESHSESEEEEFALPLVEEEVQPAVEREEPRYDDPFLASEDSFLGQDEEEEEEEVTLASLFGESDPFATPASEEDTTSDAYQEEWGEYDDDPLRGFDLDAILSAAIDAGASDVDILPNDEISFEVLGDMRRLGEFGLLSPEVTNRLQLQIISHVLQTDFVENLELDTAYVLKKSKHAGRRMRLSIGKSFGEIFLVFRVIADRIPTPEDLRVPAAVQSWCNLPSGLVLICGPTGSGKSTTFASMIRKIQLTRAKKIITIENPIEYVFGRDGKAIVVQREVGRDTRTFAAALKSAMRQHPKIIMVGEVRDQEEVDEVLRAAETGHLALTTLHATTPPGAVSRIMSLYEGEDRLRVLSSMKANVRGIANQTLVKSKDGRSRFALHSVLEVTPAVALMIGEGDVEGLESYMRDHGLTMEHQLVKAVKAGRCSLEDARDQAAYPAYFDELMG